MLPKRAISSILRGANPQSTPRERNTKQEGVLEFLIYPEKGHYVGVCLTLNIVEESDNLFQLMESIKEAAIGHVILVTKENLSDDLLNRPAPKEYWDKYISALEGFVHERGKEKKQFTFQLPINTMVLQNA